ncbi:FAD-dependent oxidoreductase [Nocardia sp. NPDC004123]
MHVVIIGGGIGGLALAQGLRKQGVSFEIHERETTFGSRLSGYRIDIEEMGARALKAVLPQAAWDRFRTTRYRDDAFVIMNDQLGTLLRVDGSVRWPSNGEIGDRYGIDRGALRTALLTGLEDVVRFGAEFTHYTQETDGRVTAVFADGTRATGDVLVGADGSTSRVGSQYLPSDGLISSGVMCVAHKLPLDDRSRAWLPPALSHGVALILGSTPTFGFNAVFDPVPESGFEPYVLQAISWPVEGDHDNPEGRPDELVTAIIEEKIRGWHPDLRRQIRESDIGARASIMLKSSPKRAPWEPSNVVLLGDAVHSMPPTVGRGGNTALRDAHHLAIQLGRVARGTVGLLPAVGEYEKDMREYGYGTIDESMEVIDRFSGSGTVGLALSRLNLRLINAIGPLRDRIFAGPSGTGQARPWELAADRLT